MDERMNERMNGYYCGHENCTPHFAKVSAPKIRKRLERESRRLSDERAPVRMRRADERKRRFFLVLRRE